VRKIEKGNWNLVPAAARMAAVARGSVLPAIVITSMLATSWIALAQASRLEFEAASVKRNTSSAMRGDMHFESARFVATWRSLRNLIIQAYGVENYQISGFPSFLEDERYDIEGKSAQPASQEQLRLMLRTLLEDRFSLQVRREVKEMPAYILSVGKNGPKLQPAKENERSTITLVPRPLGDKTGYELVGQKIPVGVLTGMLTAQLGRPVLDHTGLTGDFNFKADIGPDDSAQVSRLADGQPTTDKAAIVAVSPSAIVTALQADLGLKLESTKGPIEILVIDHAEKPSEN
jgi:uncharacterized protein (TIGR03435 family)